MKILLMTKEGPRLFLFVALVGLLVSALQSASEGSEQDQRLRETIIKLVLKLDPAPAIPEEARRFAVRGKAAIGDANSESEYAEAASEFKRALRAAPWWAETYYNLAVVQEKAGQLNEAIRSLKLYLLVAPEAKDFERVKDHIYELEFRQEKAQKDATARQKAAEEARRRAERERQQQAAIVQRLTGDWVAEMGSGGNRPKWRIIISGNQIEMVLTAFDFRDGRGWRAAQSVIEFSGTVDGHNIAGMYKWENTSDGYWGGKGTGSSRRGSSSAAISSDGTKIQFHRPDPGPMTDWPLVRQ